MDSKFAIQAGGDAMSMEKVTTTRGVREALDPRAVSITGTAGLTQTKPSGPLGQFQVCLVKPLARFLTVPYLRTLRILQFSRTVHVFHMQSVYIARQAIHLVIILNDLVDVQEGPDDDQYEERIDLEDELIELFDAMRKWGAKPDEGLQVDYEQRLLKINQQYAQFFRERFYFHNARKSADDHIYRKLVAYDRKTIDFRKWQQSRPDPNLIDIDRNGSKARDEGNAGHGSEAYIESATSSPDSSGVGVSTRKELLTHPVDESSTGETRWVLPDTPMTDSEFSAGDSNQTAVIEDNEKRNTDEKLTLYSPAATPFEPNPDAILLPLETAVDSRLFGVALTPSLEKPFLNSPIHPLSPKDPPTRLYSSLPASDYYGAPSSSRSGAAKTHQGEPRDSPPPFRPTLEGRLFTAHDSIIGADSEVHPTARLLYDSLPQHYRDVFKNCPMYPEKHLEFVKYLHHLSLNDLDKRNEPSSERDLIKTLGIPVSTEEGDKKKWQCGAVGCAYRGTLQHLVSHLRTKSHIGIPTFACTLDCKILFHHSQDRDRHVKEKTCLKSRLVEDAAERRGSTRSLRGAQDTFAAVPKFKAKSRLNQHLAREREYQIPAQVSAQGINDPGARTGVHYDPMSQAPGYYNPGMPYTSFVSPQVFGTPVHLTHAYNRTHSNIPTTQDGHARPLTPDFFPMLPILPTNDGGMHANVITNNHHIYGTTDNFQPTGNPQFTPGSQPVKPEFKHPTGPTYGPPSFELRGQDPGQSSTSHSANFARNFYGDGAPQRSHRTPQDSRKPPPYVGTSNRPEVWGVRGIKEEEIKEEEEEEEEEEEIKKEEEEEMRIDLDRGVVAMDVTP